MDTIVLDAAARSFLLDGPGVAPASRTSAPAGLRPAPARPGRRSGRGVGPQARPVRPVPAAGRLRPRSCTPPAPGLVAGPAVASAASPAWRLTERGVALVLVTGLLITVAALAVVGLTAVRVTGERYTPAGHSVLSQG